MMTNKRSKGKNRVVIEAANRAGIGTLSLGVLADNYIKPIVLIFPYKYVYTLKE